MIEKLHSLYADNNYVDSLMKDQKEDFGYHICTPKVDTKTLFFPLYEENIVYNTKCEQKI